MIEQTIKLLYVPMWVSTSIDPKAHSKGGTLENTINGSGRGTDDENSGPPSHLIHPGKVNFIIQ